MSTVFVHNVIALILRLLFVILLVPRFGITAYLWGSLTCEILLSLMHVNTLRQLTRIPFSALRGIVLPVAVILIAGGIARSAETVLSNFFNTGEIPTMIVSMLLLIAAFLLFAKMIHRPLK